MKHLFRAILTCTSLLGLSLSSVTLAEPDTIYLVRHTEKVAGSGDVLLSESGEARAEWLAGFFRDKGLTRVYSTPYNRTMGTAEIIIQDQGLGIEVYDPRALPDFASALKDMSGVILIVGHSNTTPGLAEHLGGDPGTPIEEKGEYDRIYKLDFLTDGSVKTTMHHSEPRFQDHE